MLIQNKLRDSLYLIPLLSTFVAMMSIVAMLQINMALLFPTAPFLNLDFSMVILVVAFFMFGFKFSFIMSVLSPWISLPFMTFPDVIGTMFLMLLNIVLITILFLCNLFKLNKNKKVHYLILSIITTFIVSIVSGFIGMFLIYPLYGFAFNNSTFVLIWSASFPFTLFKLTIVFSIVAVIYPALMHAFGNRLNIIQHNKW